MPTASRRLTISPLLYINRGGAAYKDEISSLLTHNNVRSRETHTSSFFSNFLSFFALRLSTVIHPSSLSSFITASEGYPSMLTPFEAGGDSLCFFWSGDGWDGDAGENSCDRFIASGGPGIASGCNSLPTTGPVSASDVAAMPECSVTLEVSECVGVRSLVMSNFSSASYHFHSRTY